MWNRFGRVVTLGVGAGVHCYLNCRSCTHVCVSIGFSQFQMIPNSCMWDHGLPAGIAPAEDEQAFSTRHFAPVEDALLFCFLISYSMYPNLLSMISELTDWRYPNLLPVAGGGGRRPSRYATVPYCFLTTRILFRGHSGFKVCGQLPSQLFSRLVTHHLSWRQLPDFGCQKWVVVY